MIQKIKISQIITDILAISLQSYVVVYEFVSVQNNPTKFHILYLLLSWSIWNGIVFFSIRSWYFLYTARKNQKIIDTMIKEMMDQHFAERGYHVDHERKTIEKIIVN